jgi:hypothetical protein
VTLLIVPVNLNKKRESNLGNVREGAVEISIGESNSLTIFSIYVMTLGLFLVELSGGAAPVGPSEC